MVWYNIRYRIGYIIEALYAKGMVMNQFQKNIIQQMPQFTLSDFTYFIGCSHDKVKKLPLAADCTIHQAYKGSGSSAPYIRAEYCLKNCGFKCIGITGGSYKKI